GGGAAGGEGPRRRRSRRGPPNLRVASKLRQNLLDPVEPVAALHGAELRAAHGAEFGALEVLGGQTRVVHGPGGLRVERQGELLLPIEGIAGPRQGVIPVAGARTLTGDVRGVGGDLVGDDSLA